MNIYQKESFAFSDFINGNKLWDVSVRRCPSGGSF